MKRTSLYRKHIDAGAKMVSFAGFEMPVQYKGTILEHKAVRENLGLFDVSHMGQFFFSGKKSAGLLQKITTNDVSKLKIGQAQYSCMTNMKGGIVDDLVLYYLAENEYMMVVNAANIDKDWEWIGKQNSEGVVLENKSNEMALLAIQGPKAVEAMQSLTDYKLEDIEFYHFAKASFAGIKDVIISGTGYTGSGGFEIYLPTEDAPKVWDAILKAGKEFGIELCGLAARDTLRLEKGYCLYGNDINDNTTPLEAGLGWITKLSNDFIASDIIEEEKQKGSSKKLKSFIMKENAIPRKDYPLTDEIGNEIGIVTSGTMSPMLKKGIGLGYINSEYLASKRSIYVMIRKKLKEVSLTKLPFV